MSKWKPWQRFVFLGYLLALNLIIFGTLTFLVVNTYLRPKPQPTAIIVAVPSPESWAIFSTITPASQALESITPTLQIPLTIPAVPVLTQTDEAVSLSQAKETLTLVEGSRSQARQAAPTPTPAALAQLPSPTPTPVPTNTSAPPPQPTATSTSTQTPRPMVTAISTPTPLPTATHTPPPTSTPTHTPQPTATSSLTRTSTPSPQPTAKQMMVPGESFKASTTLTPMVTRIPHPFNTPKAFASVTPSATIPPMPSSTPVPTARPTQNPTPAVVAAALKSEKASPSIDLPAARPAQPNASEAAAAGLVKAIPLTNATIALSWAPAGKSVQYHIYSDMGSGFGVYIHKANVSEPAFVDDLLQSGRAYSYRVTRLDASQEVFLAQIAAATQSKVPATNNNLSSPVPTATIAPAPTALPADAILLGLLSDNSFTDDFNTLNIVGEVRNDSNLDVGQTDIAVTFYDSAGVVIGTASGSTILDVIPPGETSPFLITLSRPSSMDSYSLRAVARPAAPKLNAQLAVIQVKRYEDDAGFFHVQGVVENTGSLVAKRAKVAAVIYGRGGGIINVGFTYLNPPILAPGERAVYEVIFTYFPKYVNQKVIPFEE